MKNLWKWFAKHIKRKPLTKAEKKTAIIKAITKEFMDKRKKGLCPFCNNKVNPNEFRDELSKKEFEISGLCQKCQDGTFKNGKEKNRNYFSN